MKRRCQRSHERRCPSCRIQAEDHRSHHRRILVSFYRAAGDCHAPLSSCKHGVARDPNIDRCVQPSKHRVTLAGHPVVVDRASICYPVAYTTKLDLATLPVEGNEVYHCCATTGNFGEALKTTFCACPGSRLDQTHTHVKHTHNTLH